MPSLKMDVFRLNYQSATLWHGVTGIQAKIHQHLSQMRCATNDRPEFKGDSRFDLDGLWKSGSKHSCGFLDQALGLDRYMFFSDSFGKREKLCDQVSSVFSI